MKNKKYTLIIVALILLSTIFVYFKDTAISAVSTITGMAIQQSTTIWNNLKDAAIGDNQSSGIAGVNPYVFDGTNFDRVRGTTTYGMYVDVRRIAGTGGNEFYAIKKANLDPNSFNFDFGFTCSKIGIETPYTNTDDVVIDWLGDTAIAPSANTAGDDLIPPGRIILLDDYETASISAASVSGTQTVYVRAYR